MLRCLSLPGLTGNERAVLIALAYHDGRGGCFPKDHTILAETALPFRSSVIEARKGLRKKGRLRWTRGEHVNHYEIAYSEPFDFGDHCPGQPDNALSGAAGFDCPGQPDAERVEPDPLSAERQAVGAQRAAGSGQAAAKGKSRAAAIRARCRTPELCAGLGSDQERCSICGADQ